MHYHQWPLAKREHAQIQMLNHKGCLEPCWLPCSISLLSINIFMHPFVWHSWVSWVALELIRSQKITLCSCSCWQGHPCNSNEDEDEYIHMHAQTFGLAFFPLGPAGCSFPAQICSLRLTGPLVLELELNWSWHTLPRAQPKPAVFFPSLIHPADGSLFSSCKKSKQVWSSLETLTTTEAIQKICWNSLSCIHLF